VSLAACVSVEALTVTPKNIVLGLLLVITLGVSALFWFQNQAQTAILSLNLYFAAWTFSGPIPVATLMLGAAGAGLLTGLVLGGASGLANGRKVRSLERELALGGRRDGPGAWGA
jgi:uncharacterized integral membrane protein